MNLPFEIEKYIQEICKKEIEKQSRKQEVGAYGEVVEVDDVNKLASVRIAGFHEETGMIQNATGEDLVEGDGVRVYYVGNIANGYVGLKLLEN